MLMRVIQGAVGFVIGAGFVAGLELLGIYLVAAMSSGHLAPKGIGWFIAPLLAGFAFGRACAENRHSRLFEIWFLGAFAWIVAAAIFYRYGTHDGSAKTALTIAASAYAPLLISFAALLLYRRFSPR